MSIQILVARAGRHSEKRLARNRMNFQTLRNVEERRRTYAPLLERRSPESPISVESSLSGASAHNQDRYTLCQISQKAMSIQILVARAGRHSEKRLTRNRMNSSGCAMLSSPDEHTHHSLNAVVQCLRCLRILEVLHLLHTIRNSTHST